MNTLLNAISQRMADNRGLWSTTCGASTVTLPSSATIIGSGAGNINLDPCVVPTYVSILVTDPSNGTAASSGYTVLKDANSRITINAPYAELGASITVTR